MRKDQVDLRFKFEADQVCISMLPLRRPTARKLNSESIFSEDDELSSQFLTEGNGGNARAVIGVGV